MEEGGRKGGGAEPARWVEGEEWQTGLEVRGEGGIDPASG